MRKVKDAVDLTTNEKIYFKGHAKATYLSDGRNVEDALGEIPSAESDVFKAIYGTTTYEEVSEAYNQGKIIHCDYDNNCYVLSQFTDTTAWLSALNVTTNYMLAIGKNGWGIANYTMENTGNRKKVINAESTDESYPTCKAVYDFVQNSKDVFEAVYDVTTYEEIVEARNAGKVVICQRGYDITILTQLSDARANFGALIAKQLIRLTCVKGGSWSYELNDAAHSLSVLDNGNVQVTIAGKTAEVATPQYVDNAIQQSGGGGASTKRFASLYETTIEAETDRLDLITLVPNILDNKDFVIEMELAAGDGTNERTMRVNFSNINANFNVCWINGLNKATYQTHYLIKIHIGNDWGFDSSCYVECHNNSWNNVQRADGLQGLNLFIYQKNTYPIDTMYINFPFKVGDKVRIYGK